MARKAYSEEFRRQAVELYETTPGATVRQIADDLVIVRGTLTLWLRELNALPVTLLLPSGSVRCTRQTTPLAPRGSQQNSTTVPRRRPG